jgi:hypothetical protein
MPCTSVLLTGPLQVKREWYEILSDLERVLVALPNKSGTAHKKHKAERKKRKK